MQQTTKKNPFKDKSAIVVKTDLQLKVYADFPETQWQLTKFKLIQAFMYFLGTRKNEEDPIKNEGVRVVTTLSINF